MYKIQQLITINDKADIDELVTTFTAENLKPNLIVNDGNLIIVKTDENGNISFMDAPTMRDIIACASKDEYERGQSFGYDIGYEEGHDNGYDVGYADGKGEAGADDD